MRSKDRPAPCLEKDCHECCDPVLMQKNFPDNKIPRGSDGGEIWTKREETWIPENEETVRLQPFDCKKFDSKTGLCQDYENRPEICRITTCVNGSADNTETLQKETEKQSFFKIPNKIL